MTKAELHAQIDAMTDEEAAEVKLIFNARRRSHPPHCGPGGRRFEIRSSTPLFRSEFPSSQGRVARRSTPAGLLARSTSQSVPEPWGHDGVCLSQDGVVVGPGVGAVVLNDVPQGAELAV